MWHPQSSIRDSSARKRDSISRSAAISNSVLTGIVTSGSAIGLPSVDRMGCAFFLPVVAKKIVQIRGWAAHYPTAVLTGVSHVNPSPFVMDDCSWKPA